MNIQLLLTRIEKLWRVIGSRRLTKKFLFEKVLAGMEHQAVLSRELGVVVDIGANRGQFALAVRHFSPKAKIISFEPLLEPSKKYTRVFKHDCNIELHRIAIGSESGKVAIHVSQRDDSSSLLPIGDAQDRLFPGTAEDRTEIIQVARLEEFLSVNEILSPALLKLDIQGFELTALRGCESLLDEFSYIYVECSFVELYEGQALADEIISWLKKHHFSLSGIYNMQYDSTGLAIQGDFFFGSEK